MPYTTVIGRSYGMLRVVDELPPRIRKNNRARRYFVCLCECGGYKTSSWDNLSSGAITHCGCKSPRHGGANTKLYGVWRGIMQRCYDRNYQAYRNYGARGIITDGAWLPFPKFREWALGSGYAEGLSIERVNNDAGYFPHNCTWVRPSEQSRNRRTTVWVVHAGAKMTATDAARMLNAPLSSVLYRHKRGLPLGGVNAVQRS